MDEICASDDVMSNALVAAKEHKLHGPPVPKELALSELTSATTTGQNFRQSAASSAATSAQNFRKQYVVDRPPAEVPRNSIFGRTDVKAKRKATVIEMLEYVKALDIDPVREGDLLWIAEDAFSAPLPPNWSEHLDDEGRVYYHNEITGESAWVHPMDKTFREVAQYQRDVKQAGGFWYLDDKLNKEEDAIRDKLQYWMELFDEHGEKFFYNKATEDSTYDDPRVAAYHDLYYRIKEVSIMKEKFPDLARNHRPKEVCVRPNIKDIELQNAVKVIQSVWRMLKARKRLKLMRERRAFRDSKGMQGLRLSIMKNDKGQKDLVLSMTTDARRDKAACKIQSFLRGRFSRKRVLPMLLHRRYQNNLMIPIQTQARVWLAKRRVARIRLWRKEAFVLKIQRCYRGYCGRRYARGVLLERKKYLHMIKAVILIQAGMRRTVATWRVSRIRVDKHTRLMLIFQNVMRGYIARKKLLRISLMRNPVRADLEFRDETPTRPWFFSAVIAPLDDDGVWLDSPHSVRELFKGDADIWGEYFEDVARLIQRCARGLLGRLRVRKRKFVAAGVLQHIYQQTTDKITWRFMSARKLQSCARGHLIRMHDVLRQKFMGRFAQGTPGHVKLSTLQSAICTYLTQERVLSQMKAEEMRAASTDIQRIWRGGLGRRHVERLLEEKLWPLKGWFNYTVTGGSTGGSCVRCTVQFLPNVAFDDYRYFVDFGGAADLHLSLDEMELEVALCVDQYLNEYGFSPGSPTYRLAPADEIEMINVAVASTMTDSASLSKSNVPPSAENLSAPAVALESVDIPVPALAHDTPASAAPWPVRMKAGVTESERSTAVVRSVEDAVCGGTSVVESAARAEQLDAVVTKPDATKLEDTAKQATVDEDSAAAKKEREEEPVAHHTSSLESPAVQEAPMPEPLGDGRARTPPGTLDEEGAAAEPPAGAKVTAGEAPAEQEKVEFVIPKIFAPLNEAAPVSSDQGLAVLPETGEPTPTQTPVHAEVESGDAPGEATTSQEAIAEIATNTPVASTLAEEVPTTEAAEAPATEEPAELSTSNFELTDPPVERSAEPTREQSGESTSDKPAAPATASATPAEPAAEQPAERPSDESAETTSDNPGAYATSPSVAAVSACDKSMEPVASDVTNVAPAAELPAQNAAKQLAERAARKDNRAAFPTTELPPTPTVETARSELKSTAVTPVVPVSGITTSPQADAPAKVATREAATSPPTTAEGPFRGPPLARPTEALPTTQTASAAQTVPRDADAETQRKRLDFGSRANGAKEKPDSARAKVNAAKNSTAVAKQHGRDVDKKNKDAPTGPRSSQFKFIPKPSLALNFFNSAAKLYVEGDSPPPDGKSAPGKDSPDRAHTAKVSDAPQAKSPGELPPVRPPSRKKSPAAAPPEPTGDAAPSASYAGKVIDGKFVRKQVPSVDHLTKEERAQLLKDMEKERMEKAKILAERQRKHAQRKKEEEEKEKRKFALSRAKYEDSVRERQEKKPQQVLSWIARKEEEDKVKRREEKKILVQIAEKKRQRKLKEEQWEQERQAMREKNFLAVQKKKQMLELQIAEAREATPEEVIVKRHVHHHIHYHHRNGEEDRCMLDLAEQQQLERESEETVHQALLQTGELQDNVCNASHKHYHTSANGEPQR